VKFEIIHQGKPVVNPSEPFIVAQGEGFVAFEIDMRSKWCELDSTCSGLDGNLSLCVGTTDRSCHLDDSQECPWTEILFPDYNCKEWDIFVAECVRYTLRVVLTKKLGH
jgi:hypothetical protein